MTDATGKLLTDEPREHWAAQVQAEIAAACQAMYHTLAELDQDDPQVRHRYVQDCRQRLAGYKTALAALIGVAEAEEALSSRLYAGMDYARWHDSLALN